MRTTKLPDAVLCILPTLLTATEDCEASPGDLSLSAGDTVCDTYGIFGEDDRSSGETLRVDNIAGAYGWIPRGLLAPSDAPDSERVRWWLSRLGRHYKAADDPLCSVCGGEMSIGSMGPKGVSWLCSTGTYDDEGRFTLKEGRGPGIVDDHLSRSSVHQYPSELGDRNGLALVAFVEALL